ATRLRCPFEASWLDVKSAPVQELCPSAIHRSRNGQATPWPCPRRSAGAALIRPRAEWRRVRLGGRRPTNARRPTRRRVSPPPQADAQEGSGFRCEAARLRAVRRPPRMPRQERGRWASAGRRSEEHTSELQSLTNPG